MNLCPVVSFERAGDGYAEQVGEWIANPHAYFKSFGPEARTFQKKHPSERLRTMTLVAPAAELAALRPVCLSLDGREVVATQRGDRAGRSLYGRGMARSQGGDRPQAFGGAGVHGRTPCGTEGLGGSTSLNKNRASNGARFCFAWLGWLDSNQRPID